MMRIRIVAAYVLLPVMLVGEDPPPAQALPPAEAKRFERGKEHYLEVCASCHQPTGLGLEGLAPPLANSAWITGPAGRPARIVLSGVRGQIVAGGMTFSAEMPPLGTALDDDEIAELLTYLRNEWGNRAAPVQGAEIRAIRTADGGHEGWTAEELEKAR